MEEELRQEETRCIKQKAKPSIKRRAITVVIIIYAVFSAIIYLNEIFWNVSWIPKWHQLYEFFGLSDAAYNDFGKNELAIHYIDVEQGNCALVICGDYNILIDSGEYEYAPDVIRYLNSLEIKSLDMVIATHPHSDHIGAMYRIIETFGTDVLVMPKLTDDMIPITSSYVNLLEAAENCGAKVKNVRAGESFGISDELNIEILAPVNDYTDLNNYSIVAKIIYGGTKFLFTGDIENLAERDIYDSGADLSADVMLVAHHGSSTSSLKVFVQSVNPEYAVISVGAPNDYGHPHDKTLDLLELLGIEIYRTDKDGNIVFVSDGRNIRVNTSKEREAA